MTNTVESSSFIFSKFKQIQDQLLKDNNVVGDWSFKNYVFVKSVRELKKLFFIDVNDGSIIDSVQTVFFKDKLSNEEIKLLKSLTSYSVIYIDAKIKYNLKNNNFELIGSSFKIKKIIKNNPIQKQVLTLDFLRTYPEYRIFTKTFYAIFKIRSKLFHLINQFLSSEDYLYVNSPIITNNDAEGSGEVFQINTSVDPNFFQDKGFLTVSGQLHIEPFAMAFDQVYIFSPCFRSEKSNTSKHLSEFWMLELEAKNKNSKDMILLMQKMINFIASYLLKDCQTELKHLAEKYDSALIDRIEKWQTMKINFLTYTEAVEKINEYSNKNKVPNLAIKWGEDLGSVHEKFLTSTFFNDEFVAILQFPKEIKPFYMKSPDTNEPVYNCYDIIAPFVGEIVGGSEREDDFELLRNNFEKTSKTTDTSKIEWYLNLRNHAYYKLVGLGLGFERLVMLFTAQSNIKDVIPYPRFYNSFLK
ncbi:asparagine--tRNA ligase [Mycoplasma sp. SG1]|uniref:asparagine--tRNA ligase n=1 Tax=Mycoplasma sp. SG1 TaxID=2810348 RepID=UPI0020241F8B|nr:asparagine--tRNA ligase [Mycoplasma sp. SG1]URM52928.1 asparagine--tRNA ligase [Mycoplasma sp. SG1]